MATTQVYLILGCKGTGQFKVVADLIDFGTAKEERSLLLHSKNDAEAVEAEFKVASREAKLASYRFENGTLSAEVPEDLDLVFFVADGLADPADFVEAFHAWLSAGSYELGRVITVLNSGLAIERKEAFPWFDACLHFSDIALLAKRENLNNKQVKDFIDHYSEECYPCLFEYVKKGRVGNPGLVLENQMRRITRIFDVPEIFEDDEDEDIFEEELSGDLSKDPFLKKVAGGKRERELPNIADFL